MKSLNRKYKGRTLLLLFSLCHCLFLSLRSKVIHDTDIHNHTIARYRQQHCSHFSCTGERIFFSPIWSPKDLVYSGWRRPTVGTRYPNATADVALTDQWGLTTCLCVSNSAPTADGSRELLVWQQKPLSRGKTYPQSNVYKDVVTHTSVKIVSWHC